MNAPKLSSSFETSQPAVVIPPPIPAFSWSGSLSPLLLMPIAVPVLIALFAPDNILDLWPLGKRFTNWIQRIVPFIDMSAHANSTAFPQVAVFTHSLTVLLIPVLALVSLVQSAMVYPQNIARRKAIGRMPIKQHLLILTTPFLFVAGVIFVISLPGDPSFAKGLTTQSRLGFAIVEFWLIYLTALSLGVQLVNVRLAFDTYIQKEV